MNEDIIEAQNSLEAFVEEAKRTRLVWALTQDSQLAVWSDEEGFVLPIWSNEQNARSGLATFPGYEVRSYALEAMLEEVFPTLGDQEIMIGLNLDDSMGGMDVSMSELERLLSAGSD